MNRRNSTVKNAAWIISCKIIQSLVGIIINMLSAQYLGPSQFGIINYAASITSFLLPVTQLGFRSTLVREIIEQPDKEGETVGTALFFCLLSSAVCIIGIVSFVCIATPNEPVTIWVCMLYSISLTVQAVEMIQYWFQAKLISQYTSLTSLFAYTVVAIYRIYLLATEKSVYWFSVTYAIDHFIISAILIVYYHKLGGQKFKVKLSRFKQMISASKYFILSSLMVTIFAQTDKIMLKLMLSDEAVGVYSVAVGCAGMTSFVFAAIIDSARPSIFENKKHGQASYENSLMMCYSVIIWLSLIQSAVMSMLSKPIIRIMYGEAYSESAAVLGLVVWYTTFSYVGSVRNIWIIAEDKQKYLWAINMSGALANVLLNAILIPVMGTMGAALASLLTQIFTNVIIGFLFKPIRDNNVLMVRSLNPRILLNGLREIKR